MEIVRISDNGTQTLGRLTFDGFSCDTLELPYKDNARRISCFPPGTYICKKVGATKAIPYPHISITNVPNRDGICIHKANYVSDLRGCIGVGNGLADLNKDGQLDIINSKKTFEAMMALLPSEFTLTVTDKIVAV